MPDIVVLHGGWDPAPMTAAARGTLEGVATLAPRAADAKYRSCGINFSDKPAAAAIALKARAYILAHGLATAAQIDDKWTDSFLTDDPLEKGKLFFAVVLGRPNQPNAAASFTPIVAVIDRNTQEVIEADFANWYAGQ